MRIIIFTLFGILPLLNAHAQTPTYTWGRSVGTTDFDEAASIAHDASGNVFVAGKFRGTVDFDPGTGTFFLTSFGDYDVFVLKLDQNGQFLWAGQFGGIGEDYAIDIAIDPSGNIVLTGTFQNSADFDPGPGAFVMSSAGYFDAFVLKLSNTGVFDWAVSMGAGGAEVPHAITTDAAGNIYSTGEFESTVDFRPGLGTVNLSSSGFMDVYIQKLSPAGFYVWARKVGGSFRDYAQDIIVDASQNVYLTGRYEGTANFDPFGTQNRTANGGWDIFTLQLTSVGLFSWVQTWGGTGTWDEGAGITMDSAGDLYITGYFQNTVDFDPGAGVSNHTSNGNLDIYLQKLSATGSYIWTRTIGSTGTDMGLAIDIDSSDDIFIVGDFDGTVDFDPGAGVDNLTGVSTGDSFIWRFEQDGSHDWAGNIGGSFEQVRMVDIDNNDNIIAAGYYSVSMDADPTAGVSTLTAAGGRDAFMLKLGNPIGLPVELIGFDASLRNNGSVSIEWRTASERNSSHFVLEKSSHSYDFEPIGTIKAAGNSTVEKRYAFIDDDPVPGLNYYQLRQVDVDGNEKIYGPISVVSNQFLLYPNPAAHVINISALNQQEKRIEMIGVTAIDGTWIKVPQLSKGSENLIQLDISHLPTGSYVLHFSDSNGNQKMLFNKM